jgi:hypothetical protein
MLRSTLLALFLSGSGVWGQASAAAQDEPVPEGDDAPFLSLTFSPLHLILPMFEASVEARVGDYCGIAVLGGVGSMSVDFVDADDDVSVALWSIGAQVVAYPLEPFESLQLGIEAQYLSASIDGELDGRRVSGIGSGLAIGPLVGYKLVVDVGFTLFVQGGVAFIAIEADAEDSSGDTATSESNRVLPMLNFNIGWSI